MSEAVLDDRVGQGPSVGQRVFGIGAGLTVATLLVAAVYVVLQDDSPPTRPVHELTIVNIITPPPPPPPPQEMQQPEPEPEMIEQPEITEADIKEEAPTEEPKEAPPEESAEPPLGPLGLDQAADGPGDQFNLAANPGGRGLVNGGGGGGSRWGWYASIVQQQIESALRANPKTKSIVARVEMRIWADGSGRIHRVVISPSTGDQAVDAALRGEVLSGLVLRQPPPADMPMPIVVRVTASRAT